MKTNKVMLALAAMLIALAIWLAYACFSKPGVNLRPSSAAGEVLAEEVRRLLGGAGEVVLIGRSASRDGVDARGQQIASLQAALKRGASASLIATEWLPRVPVGMMDFGGIAAEQLTELIDKHKDAKVFVVFAGLPPLSPELAAKLGARKLKLLAVCGYSANVRNWLETHALSVAVVPRSDDLPAGTPAPKTAPDWFQREFQLITAENVDRVGPER